MKISFLGACHEVGKSAFMVETNEVKLILDAGIKIHNGNSAPPIDKLKVDAAIISHAHLDHSGSAPILFRHRPIPCFATTPSIPLINLLLEDSEKVALYNKQSVPFSKAEVKRLNKHFMPMGYGEWYGFYDGTRFKLLDAGHILGSAQVLVEGDKTLLYTGDFKREKTRLHQGAKQPKEEVDVMITESTYAGREHPPRKKLENEFVEAVQDAVADGLTVLVPSFAVGRTQEMLMVLANAGVEVVVDGMGKKVLSIMSDYPSYVRDANALQNAMENAKSLETHAQRRNAARKPCVIVSTSGMLDGGPALNYLQEMNETGKGAIFLTGYQVHGTNGWRLVNEGAIKVNGIIQKVGLAVKHFDFSAHSGGNELVEYVEAVSPQKIFCVHGDASECELLAQQLKEKGFDAEAPKEGQKTEV